MGDLILLNERKLKREPAAKQPRTRRPCVVRAFPGTRHFRMIDNVAAHMATLETDTEMNSFLVFHFEVEERRLIGHRIAEAEIDRYIFEAAREIWARLRDIREGVA